MRGANDFEQSSESSTVTTNIATTTFVDDTNRTMSNFSESHNPNSSTEMSYQSIKDFLSKPYYVTSFFWNRLQTANTLLWSSAVTTMISSNTAWDNKLQGFQMYRGTAVLSVIINANPFQQGKLLVRFLPNYNNRIALDPSFAPMHSLVLASKRMNPCVEIDCRDSGCVLKIPFVAPTDYASPNSSNSFDYDWGTFFIDVLSPMRTGASGQGDLDVSVYLHFEDFELAAPIVPQSNVASKRYKATLHKEREQLSTGQVSKGLSLASKVTSDLAQIPLLSDVATPASWILRSLSGLASHFGWSKALLNAIPATTTRQFQRYAATSDGVDTSYPLALISDNQLSISSHHALTDQDEMSFNYLKTIPTVISTFSWSVSQVSGTSLYTRNIKPNTLREVATKVVGAHTTTYGVGPPIYYLADNFELWRGSVRVTIKLVKTEFHSGRLQVTFTPTNGTAVLPTLGTATLALREIIDIRSGNEFTFDLPYLLPNRYSPMGNGSGVLNISVLTDLRCPETAANNMDILVYFSGCEDFEFQAISNPGVGSGAPRKTPFSPQMDTKQLIEEPIGGSVKPHYDVSHSSECIGEHFSSVKQLISRNSPVFFQTITTGFSGTTSSYYPFSIGVVSMDPTGVIIGPNVGGDIMSYINGMYAFFSGGVRCTFTLANVNQVSASLLTFTTSGIVSDTGNYSALPATGLWTNIAGPTPASLGWNGTVQADSNVGNINVEVPYYSHTPVSMALYTNPTTNIARTDEGSFPLVGVNLVSTINNTLVDYRVTRSVRDDYILRYFIGCPPLIESYV